MKTSKQDYFLLKWYQKYLAHEVCVFVCVLFFVPLSLNCQLSTVACIFVGICTKKKSTQIKKKGTEASIANQNLSNEYPQLFKQLLRRFDDSNSEVRKYMVSIVPELINGHPHFKNEILSFVLNKIRILVLFLNKSCQNCVATNDKTNDK